MHDVITVGLSITVPLIAILAGIFFNNRSFDKIDQRFDKINQRLDLIDADLRLF